MYESTCKEYLEGEEPEEYTYVGDSSISAYEISKDHLEDYRDGSKDSHMDSHANDKHERCKNVKWKFVIIRKALTC